MRRSAPDPLQPARPLIPGPSGALFPALLALALSVALSAPPSARAMGKAPEAPPPLPPQHGKRIVGLEPVPSVKIEFPDQSTRDFGADFQASLVTSLMQSGRFLVADARRGRDDHLHSPAATVSVRVEAFSFQTGERGERAFYGFDERFRTPFNDGSGERSNEFPLRPTGDSTGWFGKSFDAQGIAPLDSRAGLDLGDGFEINAILAYMDVKYARYHSELHLRLEIDAPSVNHHESRLIQVKGDGFFFDVAGGYLFYSGGIRFARSDAMARAFSDAVNGAFSTVEEALLKLPLTARVNAVSEEGTLFLGTGAGADVLPGTTYEAVDPAASGLRVEVVSPIPGGSLGRITQGSLELVREGMLLREVGYAPRANGVASLTQSLRTRGTAPSIETIQLPWKNFESADLRGLAPIIAPTVAYLRSLAGTATLPYRIWRYYHYDQDYHEQADGNDSRPPGSPSQEPRPAPSPKTPLTWARDSHREPYARQIGLASVTELPKTDPIRPVVAVIDSGVDYNHPAIHDAIWSNPHPVTDSRGQRDLHGWDFVSGDPRPYDDAYHGTQVASLVLSVAPNARILPIKAFNAWGITHSASLHAAFTYAVDHGARIIVCAWATPVESRALEEGIRYARSRGVAVVTAAGDQGFDLETHPAYPAAFARAYDNVLSVTAVDSKDEPLRIDGHPVSTGRAIVGIAAPGENILSAKPRNGRARDSSSSWAAALVAGSLARTITIDAAYGRDTAYPDWFEELRQDAVEIPALRGAVEGGRRLFIRK